jgi:hypothetical protein
MNDTSPEIESLFNTMMMKNSGQERLKMGFSMFDMARRQVMASIKMNNSNANIKDIKREIFLRFYGQEFSSEEQERILKRILESGDQKNKAQPLILDIFSPKYKKGDKKIRY